MSHTKSRKTFGSISARAGRPPQGELGQKISEYTQVTLRVPQRTKARLDAIAGMTGMPLWRVLDAALEAYVVGLPTGDRRVLQQVQQRRAMRD